MSDALSLLAHRRSAVVKSLTEPAPSKSELDTILTIASRVPDHGRLVPWRFIVVEGGQRDNFATVVAKLFVDQNPEADAAKIAALKERFQKSPITIIVVGRAQPHPKIPEIEQTLSIGAVCMNLLNAVSALGYGAVWLTGWAAFDKSVHAAIGIKPEEIVAGFIHVGTETEKQQDRVRPVVDEIVTFFSD